MASDSEILKRVQAASGVVLCLDFDGTLSPIRPRPEQCWLNDGQKELLGSLARHPHFKVGIVSGRALDDVRLRVGVAGIAYAGNHGLEIDDSGEIYQEPRAHSLMETLRELIQPLSAELQAIPGCWLEHKTLTVSIHFREVEACEVPRIEALAQLAIDAWPDFTIRRGKAVLEIRPGVAWNKSHAVGWIRERAILRFPDPLLIYCGDDETDEDVFRAWPEAITIQVGDRHPHSANTQVDNPDAIWGLLGSLDSARSNSE